jgi:hypothetical protein
MSDEIDEIDEQHGFHWAKSPALGWIIVEFFTPDSWYVPGDHRAWSRSDFTEIDERRIVREEPRPDWSIILTD